MEVDTALGPNYLPWKSGPFRKKSEEMDFSGPSGGGRPPDLSAIVQGSASGTPSFLAPGVGIREKQLFQGPLPVTLKQLPQLYETEWTYLSSIFPQGVEEPRGRYLERLIFLAILDDKIQDGHVLDIVSRILTNIAALRNSYFPAELGSGLNSILKNSWDAIQAAHQDPNFLSFLSQLEVSGLHREDTRTKDSAAGPAVTTIIRRRRQGAKNPLTERVVPTPETEGILPSEKQVPTPEQMFQQIPPPQFQPQPGGSLFAPAPAGPSSFRLPGQISTFQQQAPTISPQQSLFTQQPQITQPPQFSAPTQFQPSQYQQPPLAFGGQVQFQAPLPALPVLNQPVSLFSPTKRGGRGGAAAIQPTAGPAFAPSQFAPSAPAPGAPFGQAPQFAPQGPAAGGSIFAPASAVATGPGPAQPSFGPAFPGAPNIPPVGIFSGGKSAPPFGGQFTSVIPMAAAAVIPQQQLIGVAPQQTFQLPLPQQPVAAPQVQAPVQATGTFQLPAPQQAPPGTFQLPASQQQFAPSQAQQQFVPQQQAQQVQFAPAQAQQQFVPQQQAQQVQFAPAQTQAQVIPQQQAQQQFAPAQPPAQQPAQEQQAPTQQPTQQAPTQQTSTMFVPSEIQASGFRGPFQLPPPSGQFQLPPPSGPPPSGQFQLPPPGGQFQLPPPSGQFQLPPPSGQFQLPAPGGQFQLPVPQQRFVAPPAPSYQAGSLFAPAPPVQTETTSLWSKAAQRGESIAGTAEDSDDEDETGKKKEGEEGEDVEEGEGEEGEAEPEAEGEEEEEDEDEVEEDDE